MSHVLPVQLNPILPSRLLQFHPYACVPLDNIKSVSVKVIFSQGAAALHWNDAMGSVVAVPVRFVRVMSLILNVEVLQSPLALLYEMHCVMLIGSWTLFVWKFLRSTFLTSVAYQ